MKREIIKWFGIIILMIFFGALGLWKGVSKGNAQACVGFKLLSGIWSPIDCGDISWQYINQTHSGYFGLGIDEIINIPIVPVYTALCGGV